MASFCRKRSTTGLGDSRYDDEGSYQGGLPPHLPIDGGPSKAPAGSTTCRCQTHMVVKDNGPWPPALLSVFDTATGVRAPGSPRQPQPASSCCPSSSCPGGRSKASSTLETARSNRSPSFCRTIPKVRLETIDQGSVVSSATTTVEDQQGLGAR